MCILGAKRLPRFVSFGAVCAAAALIGCGGGSSGGSNGTGPPIVTLQSITVTSPSASVAAGLTEQFTAMGNFSDGTTKPLATANWSTSDATLATVSATGLLTTLKQGAVTVSAASGTATGGTSFNISPAVPISIVIPPPPSSTPIPYATPIRSYGNDWSSAPRAAALWR